MKIYARQVNPAIQESHLFLDECFPDDIIVTGNRGYNDHTTPEYDKITNDFDEMARAWERDRWFYQWKDGRFVKLPGAREYTLQEVLTDYGFTRSDGKPWSTQQRHKWGVLMETERGTSDEDTILAALELLTGHAWQSGTIRGCCQGEWRDVLYQADKWPKERLEAFEVEYFNLGTEWIVHDKDTEPEGPEDICGFSIYCIEQSEEGIAAAIADAAGGNSEDVVLYEYDGELRVDKYKKVEL